MRRPHSLLTCTASGKHAQREESHLWPRVQAPHARTVHVAGEEGDAQAPQLGQALQALNERNALLLVRSCLPGVHDIVQQLCVAEPVQRAIEVSQTRLTSASQDPCCGWPARLLQLQSVPLVAQTQHS